MYAILTAVFFFLALTNAGGPQKHFGSLAPLFSLFRRELSAGRRNGRGIHDPNLNPNPNPDPSP